MAYLGLPYFPTRGSWRPIIDEVPQLDRFFAFADQDVAAIKSHLELDSLINDRVARLRVKSRSRVERYLAEVVDKTSPVRKLMLDATSPNKDIYVDLASWQQAEEQSVHIVSLLNARPFGGAILMGSFVEQTLLGTMLHQKGVDLVKHAPISQQLRYQSYSPNMVGRLTINYILEGRLWSKTLRDTIGKSERKVIEEVEEVVQEALGDSPYLLAANNDYMGGLAKPPNCVRLPAFSHGLNTYAQHTNLVFLAALNRNPVHHRLLQQLGFSPAAIRRSTVHEVLQQAVMRTNLRVPSSSAKVRVIVPDAESANFLASLFNGAEVSRIGNLDYQRPRPFTGKERKQRHRLKKARSGRKEERFSIDVLKKDCSLSRPTTTGGNVLFLTMCGRVYCKDAAEFVTWVGNPLELVHYLKAAARTPYNSKDELVLICLTEFDPSIDPSGYRKQANIKLLYGMILDFDGGNLSPEQLQKIFWLECEQSLRFSFIVCNSFSRSPREPNRYRVIIPFRSPTTLKMYQALFDMIVERLEQHGFTQKEAKLDPVCRAGNQVFREPGTNRLHPEWAFCRVFGLTRTRDFLRYALDPTAFTIVSDPITEHQVGAEPDPSPSAHHSPRETAQATGGWQMDVRVKGLQAHIRSLEEDRHHPFFEMGIELRSMGYALETIAEILDDTAGSDEKMLQKAADIVSSLRRYSIGTECAPAGRSPA